MAVQIQRERCRLVAQHRLHNLDVGTWGNRQTDGCVPQFMRIDARNADLLDCRSQRGALESLRPRHLAARVASEDEITADLPSTSRQYLPDEKSVS
jgi:hypothetical protein